jgi:BMFP domain-containing protein YqiC
MQSRNTLFDDFVKVMNGAAGTIAGMTREAQAAMQERAREWIGGLDLVSREEFDAVKARDEAEALKARVAALEAAVAGAGAVAGAEPAAAPKRRTRKAGGA